MKHNVKEAVPPLHPFFRVLRRAERQGGGGMGRGRRDRDGVWGPGGGLVLHSTIEAMG